MTSTPSNPDPIPDQPLACIKCAYDLRGSNPAGACPECGTPIATTLAALVVYRPLLDAPVPWLRTIARSLRAFVWFQLLDTGFVVLQIIVAVIGGVILLAANSASWLESAAVPLSQVASFLTLAARLAIGGLGLYSLWGLAQPEPNRPVAPKWDTWRVIGLVCFYALAFLLFIECTLLLISLCAAPWLQVDVLFVFLAVSYFIRNFQSMVWLAGGYLGTRLAVEMAGRAADDNTLKQAQTASRFYVIYLICYLVMFVTSCLYCFYCITFPAAAIVWIFFLFWAATIYLPLADLIESKLPRQ